MYMKRGSILLLFVTLATIVFCTGSWTIADDQITIIGILENSKRGVVLTANDEKYLIIGQDLTTLIGRKVKVTGEVIESKRGKSLMVAVVEIDRS